MSRGQERHCRGVGRGQQVGRKKIGKSLASDPSVERTYTPDRKAMLAALRVLLGLPKAPPGWIEELTR